MPVLGPDLLGEITLRSPEYNWGSIVLRWDFDGPDDTDAEVWADMAFAGRVPAASGAFEVLGPPPSECEIVMRGPGETSSCPPDESSSRLRRIRWTPSGDADLAGYRAEQNDGGGWVSFADTVSPEAVAGPLADGSWQLRAVAIDAGGNETAGAALSVTVSGEPDAPTGFAVARLYDESDVLIGFTFTWDAASAALSARVYCNLSLDFGDLEEAVIFDAPVATADGDAGSAAWEPAAIPEGNWLFSLRLHDPATGLESSVADSSAVQIPVEISVLSPVVTLAQAGANVVATIQYDSAGGAPTGIEVYRVAAPGSPFADDASPVSAGIDFVGWPVGLLTVSLSGFSAGQTARVGARAVGAEAGDYADSVVAELLVASDPAPAAPGAPEVF